MKNQKKIVKIFEICKIIILYLQRNFPVTHSFHFNVAPSYNEMKTALPSTKENKEMKKKKNHQETHKETKTMTATT